MKSLQYVCGFMFDPQLRSVALIEKKRPAWQAGRLNGIGGKIEPGESADDAMVREFREETGADTTTSDWYRVATLKGDTLRVTFYAAIGDVRSLRTTTDEQVLVYAPECVNETIAIPNLTWLVPMARLVLQGYAFPVTVIE